MGAVAAGLKVDEGHGCAVMLIQRFGSAANLDIHLHCLVLHGVYRCVADGTPSFIEASAPTDDELHALVQTVITRLMKVLTRRGRAGRGDGPDLPGRAGCPQ